MLVKKTKNFALKHNVRNIHDIGAPFLYLDKMLRREIKNKKDTTKGTLLFPAHSSQDTPQKVNHLKLIKEIESVSEGPYTVCFYYYDLNEKDILVYKKKKWRVVCCMKNRLDKYSLFKLHSEISRHKSVICSEFNSPLFYSMYMKKKTKVIINNDNVDDHEKYFWKIYKKKYPQIFSSFLPSEKGFKLGKTELGYSSLRDKKELKKS